MRTSLLPISSSKQIAIAVIDDDPAVQIYLRDFLELKGFSVSTFSSSEDALAHFHSCKNESVARRLPYSLLLLDIQLPGMNGIALLKSIRTFYSNGTAILMSGHSDIPQVIEGIKEGAYDYIEKPFDPERLSLLIQNALKTHFGGVSKVSNLGTSVQIGGTLCQSTAMKPVYELIRRAAPADSNVLITGESGVGKEYVAKAFHDNSRRAAGPFVSINCSAIPENLLESELFGHAKGSFTGAHQERAGLFVEADGGTLFLDEIGDLAMSLQAKLLRVIQERKVRPVGSNQFRTVNVRLVSATNKNLSEAIKAGQFREDLFYRLNVIPVPIPPLRHRKDDILHLAHNFLKSSCETLGIPAKNLSPGATEVLLQMQFPGNIRELQNMIERAAILTDKPTIDIGDLPSAMETNDLLSSMASHTPSLRELEDIYVKAILDKHHGNKQAAARVLGLSRRTLYRKLNGIQGSEQHENKIEDERNEELA